MIKNVETMTIQVLSDLKYTDTASSAKIISIINAVCSTTPTWLLRQTEEQIRRPNLRSELEELSVKLEKR